MFPNAALDFSVIQRAELFAESIEAMVKEVGFDNLQTALRGRDINLLRIATVHSIKAWREAQETLNEDGSHD